MMRDNRNNSVEEVVRVRTPRSGEFLGIVEQRLGFGKMRVICADKNVRVCRIPGKYRRRLWVKAGYVVLVKPWETQSDIRGDIIFKYRPAQVKWLRSRGFLKGLEE